MVSAVNLVNKLQESRGAGPWPPISLDIARTFPSRLGDGSTVDALQLDIAMDPSRSECLSDSGSDSDGSLMELVNEGSEGVSSGAGQLTSSVTASVTDPAVFDPIIPRTRGTFANGAASFAIHPYLGVLGNINSGGFRLCLKVRHTIYYVGSRPH